MLADRRSSDDSDACRIERSWKAREELLLARESAPRSVCHENQASQHPYLGLRFGLEVFGGGEVRGEPLLRIFGLEGDFGEELCGAADDELDEKLRGGRSLLFDIKLDGLCCGSNTVSWTFLLLGVVSFVVFTQGQCEVLEGARLGPCWRLFGNAGLYQSSAQWRLQVYVLGVRLLLVRLQGIWLLEVVDEISEVEVLEWKALVVSDVRDFRHLDMRLQLNDGSVVVEVGRSRGYFADRR